MHHLLGSTYSGDFSFALTGPALLALAVVCILGIVAMWKVFQKAGKPGWASIIPIYSSWILFEITGFPGWLALLSLIPFLNLIPAVVSIVAYFRLAKKFGKSTLFAVLTIFFPFICLLILGFGKSEFEGAASTPVAASGDPMQPSDPTNPGQPAPVYPTPAPAPSFEPQPPVGPAEPPVTPPNPPTTPVV